MQGDPSPKHERWGQTPSDVTWIDANGLTKAARLGVTATALLAVVVSLLGLPFYGEVGLWGMILGLALVLGLCSMWGLLVYDRYAVPRVGVSSNGVVFESLLRVRTVSWDNLDPRLRFREPWTEPRIRYRAIEGKSGVAVLTDGQARAVLHHRCAPNWTGPPAMLAHWNLRSPLPAPNGTGMRP